MIVSKRQYIGDHPVEEYVRSVISNSIADIDVDDVLYIDELYQLIARRIKSIEDTFKRGFEIIDSTKHVERKDIVEFADRMRMFSEFLFSASPKIFATAQAIADDIVSVGEEVAAKAEDLDAIFSEVYAALKRRNNTSSIKDEIIAYDTMRTKTYVEEATLFRNTMSGHMTLPITDTKEIPFSIAEVKHNKPKGSFGEFAIGKGTWEIVSNGYFTSRTFGYNPIFETEDSADYSRMTDGDLTTGYYVEYNSFTDNDRLTTTIEILLDDPRDVDAIEMVFAPTTEQGTPYRGMEMPFLSMLSFEDTKGKVEDLLGNAADNQIIIKGLEVGNIETRPVRRYPSPYFVAQYYVCARSVERIIIGVTADVPDTIYYPEKVISTSDGRTVRRFNYFETLILNNYEPPKESPDPRDFYKGSDLADLANQATTTYSLHDVNCKIYRYAMNIQEIKIYGHTYGTEGYAITGNLNPTDRMIACVDLYVNETVPEGCSIRYFISTDKKDWFEIEPKSRTFMRNIARRIVFRHDLDAEEGDLVEERETKEVYLKIQMKGFGGKSPILKSYAVRVKLV